MKLLFLSFLFAIVTSSRYALDSERPEGILLVGSFNIQTLTLKKLLDPLLVPIILHTIYRYDIIFLQEVISKHGSTVATLKEMILGTFENNDHDLMIELRSLWNQYGLRSKLEQTFDTVHSRMPGDEQFLYVYRKDRVVLLNSWTYNGKYSDLFERSPFVSVFRSKLQQHSKLLTLIGVHIKPSAALEEMDLLPEVYEDVANNKGVALIMGDCNADQPYIIPDATVMTRNQRRNSFPNLPKLFEPFGKYKAMIKNGVDTTVNINRASSLDRFVIQSDMEKYVVKGSAVPFYYPFHDPPFDPVWPNITKESFGFPENWDCHVWTSCGNLTRPIEVVRKVSDHFPIELMVKMKDNEIHTKKHSPKSIRKTRSDPVILESYKKCPYGHKRKRNFLDKTVELDEN